MRDGDGNSYSPPAARGAPATWGELSPQQLVVFFMDCKLPTATSHSHKAFRAALKILPRDRDQLHPSTLPTAPRFPSGSPFSLNANAVPTFYLHHGSLLLHFSRSLTLKSQHPLSPQHFLYHLIQPLPHLSCPAPRPTLPQTHCPITGSS